MDFFKNLISSAHNTVRNLLTPVQQETPIPDLVMETKRGMVRVSAEKKPPETTKKFRAVTEEDLFGNASTQENKNLEKTKSAKAKSSAFDIHSQQAIIARMGKFAPCNQSQVIPLQQPQPRKMHRGR